MISARCADEGWADFQDRLLSTTGFDLRKYRAEHARIRAGKVATFEGCRSFAELSERLDAREDGWRRLVGRLSIHVTEAFRDPGQWRVLQGLLAAKVGSYRGLNCWSAGCSTGVEAFSLAILLQAHFTGVHRILATDIDEKAIESAGSRLLTGDEVRQVPEAYRRTYLQNVDGKFQLSARIRRLVEFRRHDLLADACEAGFDVILCRNVAIYFADGARWDAYARLANSLAPSGILFTGISEIIANPEAMGLRRIRAGFYERPGA